MLHGEATLRRVETRTVWCEVIHHSIRADAEHKKLTESNIVPKVNLDYNTFLSSGLSLKASLVPTKCIRGRWNETLSTLRYIV